jgi:hypothetical protein
MARERKARSANQARAIRSKNRFWRAAMRRKAGEHENFFIAKIRDSESARCAFSWYRSVAITSTAYAPLNALITKIPAAQALLDILAIVGIGFLASFALTGKRFVVLSISASHALSHRHVNTSLSRTLFF